MTEEVPHRSGPLRRVIADGATTVPVISGPARALTAASILDLTTVPVTIVEAAVGLPPNATSSVA
ncbi:hypothetical protein [Microbacterium sufflavum]|uniref:Uncharacterized protein n=1 Tax=Microbacterium sufflavum TaxID=2851649 RepID=A0ABY4IFD5_9MICO|nr:hypothetical protein [Microbacterium sufflavum]UPL11304.1 hypothetical protein KV394_09335 [Microbacterium sufflavum]